MINTFQATDLLDAYLTLLPSGRGWNKTRIGDTSHKFVPPKLSETIVLGFSVLPSPTQINAPYVFTNEQDSVMVQTIAPFMLSHERLYHRAEELFVDIFPKSTEELLPEWENSLGLPDACLGPNPSIAARQTSVVARLAGRGGQNIPYFTSLAVNLGYTNAYIQEFGPFLADIHGADQWAIMDNFYPYAWMLIAQSIPYADAVIVCELQNLRPANTELYFYFYTSTPNTNPQINHVYTQAPTPIVSLPGTLPPITTSGFTGCLLSQNKVFAASPINTIVGTLAAQSSGNLIASVTFTLVNDDNGNFKISGNQLLVAKDTIPGGIHVIQVHLSSPNVITSASNNFDVSITITNPVVVGSNPVMTIAGLILKPVGHAIMGGVSGVLPGVVTNISGTSTILHKISLTWNAPATGTNPITYTIKVSTSETGPFTTNTTVSSTTTAIITV